MVLTLLTKIYSTYKTILTDLQCEILTLLTILSSTYNTIYIRYKNQKKREEYDKFLLVNCSSNSKEKKEIKDILVAESYQKYPKGLQGCLLLL